MAISSRRPRRPGINIWPGFVDALSQLIMVIVFVLLIFTAGQFYLTDALSGRDAALQKLTDQLNQLTDILALERRNNAALTLNVTQLTSQLQAVTAERDTLTTQVKELAAKADDATQKLQQRGLNVDIVKDFGGTAGLVVSVDPPSGTTVNVGSTVTLTIV